MVYQKVREKCKILSVVGLSVLCLGLAACGGQGVGSESGAGSATEQAESSQGSDAAGGNEAGGTEGRANGTEVNGAGEASGSEDSGKNNNASGEGSEDGAEKAVEEDMALKDACSKYFMLGVGINGSTLDNLCTYDEEYMALVEKHFNSVTMSNLMKSCYILQQKESQKSPDGMPVLDFTTIDDMLQWCMDHGIKTRDNISLIIR